MNSREIERLKRELEYGTKEYYKVALRDMIDSVWCYENYDNIESYLQDKYISSYQTNGLSAEEIREVVISQVDYLNEHCMIERNVYTDCDGITYNNIVEKI